MKRFEELVCWQLSVELKSEIYRITNQPAVRSDFDFCRQIRRSARSAPSNIAEGFARFRPADFARFLEIATASLAETKNHLHDARELGYITATDYEKACTLAARAMGASTRLATYLKRHSRKTTA